MRVITWRKLFFMCLMHPVLFLRFWRLPRNYETLEEWLRIDEEKSEIIAEIIGCKNVQSFKNQQRANMAYRIIFTKNFNEWRKLSVEPKHSKIISAIAEEYRKENKCHRQYEGKDAGIRCYCKK